MSKVEEIEKSGEREAFMDGYKAALFDCVVFWVALLKNDERLRFFMQETENLHKKARKQNEKRL